MKCEWLGCSREAEHEVAIRGATEAPLNVCGRHRIEYMRCGRPKEKQKADVQPSEVGEQAGKGK